MGDALRVRDDLSAEIGNGGLLDALNTRVMGRPLRYVSRTGSTNEDLKALAQTGASEGYVLVAGEQTRGRGRRGRLWSAPPGTSLLTSTLLRPSWLPPADGFFLTMVAGLAAAEAVEEVAAIPVELKWPNDLQIGGLKLGGILVESEIAESAFQWAIVGIGLNVNWSPESIPELAGRATALSSTLGRPISRPDLLRALLQRMEHHYLRLRSGARSTLFDAWRERLTTIGREVRVERSGHWLEGVAEDVSPTGALIVRDERGVLHTLNAGDVTVRSR